MRVTVVGCGYLGSAHAACMAELGHEVLGVEVDPSRRARLAAGEAPMFEPGLADLLARHVATGRLRFTDSFAEAGAFGDLHFVCVGTPQLPGGLGADLSQVFGAVSALAPYLDRRCLVVGKSTVPAGTAARLGALLAGLAPAGERAEVAWNPEFLREGYAVQDTLRPDRLVLGIAPGSTGAEATLRDFYADVLEAGTPLVVTDLATAELVKVAANAFLATKISFANAVAEMCEAVGADVVELTEALGYDERIGRRFLGAGVGFGGGCLPKDIRAFVAHAGELGVEHVMALLREVDAINLRARQRAVTTAETMLGGRLAGARVAVLGAAFKPDSDDVRDSPALDIAGQLHLRGADVVVCDPQAVESSRRVFPTLAYTTDPHAACAGADLVLLLTEWAVFRALDPDAVGEVVAHRRILDGRNVLDPDAWRSAGWEFRGVGRRPA